MLGPADVAMLTVAAALSTCPQAFVTRTQYVAAAVKAGVLNVALFVPTGLVVVPLAPSYH
jgi:hypothetical protein